MTGSGYRFVSVFFGGRSTCRTFTSTLLVIGTVPLFGPHHDTFPDARPQSQHPALETGHDHVGVVDVGERLLPHVLFRHRMIRQDEGMFQGHLQSLRDG